MKMQLSYWVFTSGEKGIHGLDWGVKFASETFTDKYALDVEYRAVLKNFSLNPSLKRPQKSGFLVLPFRNSEYIVGFIFPGIDHGGRFNTSSVIALVPREISVHKTVSKLLELIYCANDIPNIARKNSDTRPDFLTFDENLTGKFSAVPENLRWPERNEGYISADGDLERLVRTEEFEVVDVESDSRSKSKIEFIVAGVAVIAVIAGGIFMFTESEPPLEIDTLSQNQTAESQSLVISHDTQKQIADSKTNEPEKNIMEEIITRLESYDNTKNFMNEKSLASFDISASRHSLPEALINEKEITQTLANLFGNIKSTTTKEGFVLRPDSKKLPIEEWHTKKAEIFRVITVENLKPSKSFQHERLIDSIKSLRVKEGWLTLYFRTEHEKLRLAAFVNISGNSNPILRLECESSELIPISDGADLTAKIFERKTASGYRIIFNVSEKFMNGANDFNNCISAYIQRFLEEEH